jgi:hypothetical protein
MEMLWVGHPFIRTLALVGLDARPERPNTTFRTVAPISCFAKKTKISAFTFLLIAASRPRRGVLYNGTLH